jgi:hypothetical protein
MSLHKDNIHWKHKVAQEAMMRVLTMRQSGTLVHTAKTDRSFQERCYKYVFSLRKETYEIGQVKSAVIHSVHCA